LRRRGDPDGDEDEEVEETDDPDEEDDEDEEDDTATPDECFLESASLKLNGTSVDNLEGNATYDSDVLNFVRLQHVLGFMSSRTGNNMTYQTFMKGAFFLAYDLSCSGQSSSSFSIPAVRTGTLFLELNFSCPTPEELTLLVYAQYPSVIEIDKNLQVSKSY
jgi:hypothetical protein